MSETAKDLIANQAQGGNVNTVVKLSFEEGLLAAMQGCIQMMRAVQTNRVGHDHGGMSGRSQRERWAQAIHGQLCEHAVAKLLGVFPKASVSGIDENDPGGIAIRGTPWETGALIVNESELPAADSTPFVLVVGHWPQFRVVGWIYGREARVPKFWRPDERPASWWVPQSALRQITELTLEDWR